MMPFEAVSMANLVMAVTDAKKREPLAELVLPWPERSLHPNARVHWSKKAAIAKVARGEAYWTSVQKGWRYLTVPPGPIHVWIDGYPKDRRARDADGLLSAMKPALDGIADALGVNDRRFVPHPRIWDEVRKGGEVRVRITADLDARFTQDY